MIKINFKDFVVEYKPEINKFNNNASFDGLLFGTSEKEWDYVAKKATIDHAWTLIKEKNRMFIKHGLYVDNRLGYFVTYYAPRFDNIIVEVEEDTNANEETIEKKYEKAKEEFNKALKAYKKLKRKEFLQEVLSRIEDKELLGAIEAFGPVEAYPQNDVFIYDGYRTWADSIIFKNWNGEEKVVAIDTDGDFDIENISVCHKSDISIFFENEDGDELTDLHSELSYVPHVPELLEEVEVVK